MSVVPEMGDQESESRYRDDAQHEDRLFNAGFGHASRLAIFPDWSGKGARRRCLAQPAAIFAGRDTG
jgi:hypothetical protein